MLTFIKGAIIFFAFCAICALIIYICAINATDLEEDDLLTPEELAEIRSDYACYEDGSIDDVN